MRQNLLIMLALFLVTNLASAQQGQYDLPEPVRWKFDYRQVGDQEYELVFEADVAKGWFLYSQFLEEGGPVPTSFTFYPEKSQGVEFLAEEIKEEGKLKEAFDPVFEMDVRKFSEHVHFKTYVRIHEPNAFLNGHIRYMVCEAERCLPPTKEKFSFNFASLDKKKEKEHKHPHHDHNHAHGND